MNNDITFEKDDYIFNYRVASVIRNNDKVLIQRNSKTKHITLPGGRCELGESTEETAIREFKEETGLDTEIVKGLGMIENFFISSFNGKKYHEILVVQELKIKDSKIYNDTIIKNIEDDKKDSLINEWMDINSLKENNFKPEIIETILTSKSFIHIINKEI